LAVTRAPLGFALERAGRFLIARFPELHDVASWAIASGGLAQARAVAWTHVHPAELGPQDDAAEWLRATLARADLPEAVGLITSRHLDAYVESVREVDGARASCVATVGLGNALRAGDLPGPLARVGTINVLSTCSVGSMSPCLPRRSSKPAPSSPRRRRW
jgi:adenosylcobinamide amidohydrolase